MVRQGFLAAASVSRLKNNLDTLKEQRSNYTWRYTGSETNSENTSDPLIKMGYLSKDYHTNIFNVSSAAEIAKETKIPLSTLKLLAEGQETHTALGREDAQDALECHTKRYNVGDIAFKLITGIREI